ncbi:MAG: Ig-like domain-containing protein [Bacteroidales bacterium]|nr:Ig-like domain-containing protein [Bacteroidales bacterium]
MKNKLLIFGAVVISLGLFGSCDVYDKDAYRTLVSSVILDNTTLEIKVGDPDVKLTATVLPENAEDKTVSWSSDKTEFAAVDQEGNVHAVSEGTATITVTTTDGGKRATCTVTVKPYGPDYVEMAGLMWATTNLGATTVAGNISTCAGDYYQWGSLETLYTSIQWPDTTVVTWKSGKEKGFVDENLEYKEDANLPDANDVVKQKIGHGWRMPTSQEFEALIEACGKKSSPTALSTATPEKGVYWLDKDQTYIPAYTGVAGCLFCDGTNILFFPATGIGDTTRLDDAGSFGYYWSTGLTPTNTVAYAFKFGNANKSIKVAGTQRSKGIPVRPVRNLILPE